LTAERVDRLTPGQRSDVLALVQAATDDDEVAPLSEQVMLSAGEGSEAGGQPAGTFGAGHFLEYAGEHLSGYAHLESGIDGSATAELVVDPRDRRKGVGTALLRAVEAVEAVETAWAPPTSGGSRTVSLWSHGDLPSGRAFALHHGYRPVRELWQMRRSLGPDAPPLPAADLPQGFRARPFVIGQDEQAWLRVNARAFAEHREQGRMTRHDLDQRIAEPWFDPDGFILIEGIRGPSPALAASHWTKVVPGAHPDGEVYVVGVDPEFQGTGLGRAATILGLTHLRDKGLTEATLYVDADNAAAVSTYSRLGFARSGVDIMYSRLVHLPV
jgi:mycothiol synthase